MRKIVLLLMVTIAVNRGLAQQALPSPVSAIAAHPIDTTLASRVMNRLTDSLALTAAQQVLIHQYTWYIDSCRTAAIRVYHGTDSLWYRMNQVEHWRDSLYQRVLTDRQFVQYGTQKSVLIVNN